VFGFDRDHGLGFLIAPKSFRPPADAVAMRYEVLQSRIPNVLVQPIPRRLAKATIGGETFDVHLDFGATTSQLRESLWERAKLVSRDVQAVSTRSDRSVASRRRGSTAVSVGGATASVGPARTSGGTIETSLARWAQLLRAVQRVAALRCEHGVRHQARRGHARDACRAVGDRADPEMREPGLHHGAARRSAGRQAGRGGQAASRGRTLADSRREGRRDGARGRAGAAGPQGSAAAHREPATARRSAHRSARSEVRGRDARGGRCEPVSARLPG
jgi:hypothetical protein